MRKKLILNTISVLTICASFVLSSCGCKANENKPPKDDTEIVDKHTHTPSSDWSKDEEGHWHTCSGCDQKLDYDKHTFGDWKIISEATCLEEGKKERTCSVCGYVQSEVIAKIDHEFDTTWTSDENSHWHACKNCGEKCDVANHDFGEAVIVKEATCLEDGLKIETCKTCGYKKETIIPKLEHTISKTWSYNNLYHWHACSVCDEHFDEEVHTFKVINTVPATCSTEGFILKQCDCGYKVKEILPKIPHENISNIKVVKPTIGQDGSLTGTCECGETIKLRYPSIKEMITNHLIDPLGVTAEQNGRIMLTGKETRNIIEYIFENTKNVSLNLKSMVPFIETINGDSIDYVFPNSTIKIKEGTSLNSGAILIIDCGKDLGVHELDQLPALENANQEIFRTEASGSKTRYYLSDATIDELLMNTYIFESNLYIKNLLKNFSLGSIVKK